MAKKLEVLVKDGEEWAEWKTMDSPERTDPSALGLQRLVVSAYYPRVLVAPVLTPPVKVSFPQTIR